MTLDEAIKHAEEVMVENLEKTKNRNASDPIAINCFECVKEHQQLAEWLKELKQLREQTRWIPVSEKLPERSGDYFVCGGGKIWICEMINLNGIKDWCNDTKNPIVEAWMTLTLPQPYEGESEE